MQILTVTLANFKAHHDRHFVFQPGTNAICGENGAGKTSILEAIAWVLFNHSDYPQADLIKAGCSSAQASVSLISSHDGRCYQVRRCTSKGYDVYDPELKASLGLRKVVDVALWLRQHLGVPIDTDLAKLFANTIGIPQGTFTSDFFKKAEGRKQIFDPILKVEEYKQAFTKSSSLKTYADQQVAQLEQAIAQYQLQLADWPALQQLQATQQQEIERDQAQLQQLQQNLEQLEHQRSQLLAQAEAVQDLWQQLQQTQTQIAAKQATQAIIQQSLLQAEQAVTLCQQHHPGYLAYQQASDRLQELDQQQQQQQRLQQQLTSQQQHHYHLQLQATQLQAQLATIQQAKVQIHHLQPALAQQQALEQQILILTEQLQQLSPVKLQIQATQQQYQAAADALEALSAEINRLQSLAAQVEAIPDWEQQRDRRQLQLSRIEAAQQFAAELEQIVNQAQTEGNWAQQRVQAALKTLLKLKNDLPSLTSVIDAFQHSQAMHSNVMAGLEQILADLNQQISQADLTASLQQLQTQLNAAYQVRADFASLSTKQSQAQALQQACQRWQVELAQLQAQLAPEPDLQEQLAKLQAQLSALNDPRSQIRLRQEQMAQQSELQTKAEQLQAQQAEITAAIAAVEQQLLPFRQLASSMTSQKKIQQAHLAGYQIYLQQQQQAEQYPGLQAQSQQAIAELTALEQQQTDLKHRWQVEQQNYDPQALPSLVVILEQRKTERDQLAGGLPPKQAQLATLEQQLLILETIAQECKQAEAELATRQQAQQFIGDARMIFNKSGPRITQFYLSNISQEGDRLFRELLNRPDVALEWTDDYEIKVQTGGHWRSFPSLSGGEQMCAALAVRLALLKVLSDIDIAFFDEPTTNMDQLRRRQLAEALGNLKSFQQLFVISHDDTFESMTENIIRVVRPD
jgi:DNA repair protein SbcC/Rad50